MVSGGNTDLALADPQFGQYRPNDVIHRSTSAVLFESRAKQQQWVRQCDWSIEEGQSVDGQL